MNPLIFMIVIDENYIDGATMLASANDLIYFTELAHTLNFSRASERIGISQPSLSVAIKRLEHAIGTELFIRGKNGAVLTQAGKRLLSHAAQLLQLWHTVKSESLASHNDIQGSFIFGAHPSIALHSFSGFIPQLLKQHPKLEIQFTHDLSRKIVEGVINLSIHLGIVVNPIRHPDLVIQKLYDDQVTFWHAAHLKNITQQLSAGKIVMIADPDLIQTQWLLKKFHQRGLKYHRFVTSSHLEVIANLTAHGVGIGILPASLALSAHPHKLKPVPKMPAYDDEICLVYRHENRNTKAMHVMINAIKSHYKVQLG